MSHPTGPHDPGEPSGPGSGLRPTSVGLVVALAVVAGCAGWVAAVLISGTAASTPVITWPVTGLWVLVAAVLLGAAWRTHDRLNRKRLYVEPLSAVRLMVLGKAAAVVTPAVGGFYLGVVVWRLTVGPARLTQSGTLAQLAGALALFVAAVGGLLLQRACRLPPDDGGHAAA